MTAVCVADWESLAEAALPRDIWDFVAGGSGDESTLRANRSALDSVVLLPRMLVGCELGTPMTTRLVNTDSAMPVAVAPMAFQQALHPDGELASAAAAKAVGIPFVVSTMSSRPMEELAKTGARLWFQLYWMSDVDLVHALVERAECAGCEALMVTVDMPVMARRPRDIRNRFTLPETVRASHVPDSAVVGHAAQLRASVTWKELRDLRARTGLPLVVKGVLDPRDALLAVDCGADAVVVSNHGGRQFGAAPGACDALGDVVHAVGPHVQVLFDSGVRSGLDILRVLALGAAGVLVGRPVLWGLAVGGQAGVTDVLSLMRTELAEALLLAGCPSPAAAGELTVRAKA
jgi:4-hydroxymandelate oxidase